jgi:hypothetical protein
MTPSLKQDNHLIRDLCINMNHHQNSIFHQLDNFKPTSLREKGIFVVTVKREIAWSLIKQWL